MTEPKSQTCYKITRIDEKRRTEYVEGFAMNKEYAINVAIRLAAIESEKLTRADQYNCDERKPVLNRYSMDISTVIAEVGIVYWGVYAFEREPIVWQIEECCYFD